MTAVVTPNVGDVLREVDGDRRWLWNGSAWVEAVTQELVLARLGVLVQQWRGSGDADKVACAAEVEDCVGVWRWQRDDGPPAV